MIIKPSLEFGRARTVLKCYFTYSPNQDFWIDQWQDNSKEDNLNDKDILYHADIIRCTQYFRRSVWVQASKMGTI
jgi:hypothetical protein